MVLVIGEEMNNLAEHIVRIVLARKSECGVSTTFLANRIGMTPPSLRSVFRGERNLMADEFIRLCIFFNLKISDFYPAKIGLVVRSDSSAPLPDDSSSLKTQ